MKNNVIRAWRTKAPYFLPATCRTIRKKDFRFCARFFLILILALNGVGQNTAGAAQEFDLSLPDFPAMLPAEVGVLSAEDTRKFWGPPLIWESTLLPAVTLKENLDAVYATIFKMRQVFATPLSFDELDGLLMWTLLRSVSPAAQQTMRPLLEKGHLPLLATLRQNFWHNIWRREQDVAHTAWDFAQEHQIYAGQNYAILKYIRGDEAKLPANKIIKAYFTRFLSPAQLRRIYLLYGISLDAPYVRRFQQRGFPLGHALDQTVQDLNKLIYRKPHQRSLYKEELYKSLDDLVKSYFAPEMNEQRPIVDVAMAIWRLRLIHLAQEVRPGLLPQLFKLYQLPNFQEWIKDSRNGPCPLLFLP